MEASEASYCFTAEEDTGSHCWGGISAVRVAVRTSGRRHLTLLSLNPGLGEVLSLTDPPSLQVDYTGVCSVCDSHLISFHHGHSGGQLSLTVCPF